jgi:RHS repeat-associated protein
MHYLDGAGHEVDEARPGGRISMTEYDAFDNPVRTLDAENRARAMAYGTAAAEHAARAAQLRVERTYSADGVRELEELGPLHSVRLSSGTDVQARRHTVMTYDEGAPPTGGPFNLVTTTKVGAAISGQSDSDVRTTTRGYSGVDSAGTANAGWTWRTPTSITVDPSGLNLQTAIVPDAATGQTAERRLPGNPAGGDAHSHKTIYYTVGANAADAGCGGAPALAALPCKELPAAQPTGGTGLPALPVTTHAYNRLWLETAKTDTVGSHTRTQSKGYDAAGRQTTESVTSDHGTAEPSLTFGYDTVTGRQTTVTANDTIPKTVTGGFDNVGRLASYTDADGNPASFTYDIDGRQATVNDGKGSRTMAYDATTGDLASIVDSGAGTITGSYDADGRLVSQTLPGGLQQQTTLDAAGDSSEIKYVKSGSTWFDQTLVRNVASQIVSESSALSARTIAYDNAARVSSEKRDSGPTNCVIDAYSYDADSNRLAKLSKSCSTATGTGPTHTYDTADRLTDAGYLYDSWGRTISVPAVDAGGSVLTAGFFVDDRLRSLGQGGRTRTFDVDPLRRVRVTTAVDPRNGNKTVTTVSTHHYVNDSDSPAWTAESSDGLHWTRNITGLDGDLVAIQDNQTGVTLQIENAQGEVIAAPTVSANTLGTAKESDAFGISGSTTPPRYGWLGAKQRRTELPTGVVAMGRRAYNPYLGRFLQADPVEGGSANGYDYVNQDPLNAVDLTGECAFYKPSCILHYVKKRVISIVLGCAAGAIVGPRMHGPIIVQVGSKFLKIFPVGRVSGCVIGAIPASLT